MVGDRKAMRLIPDSLEQKKGLRVPLEEQRLGEQRGVNPFLVAYLAPARTSSNLGDTQHIDVFDPETIDDFARHIELAAPTIDDKKLGKIMLLTKRSNI